MARTQILLLTKACESGFLRGYMGDTNVRIGHSGSKSMIINCHGKKYYLIVKENIIVIFFS